ncbi:MAG: ATP-binding cassette domain-containing protein [Oscillospiraceae bacterium]
MREIIRLDAVKKDYGKGKGIFDLSLSIHEGETVGLVGVNGSGKTTTMRHLMGFLHPDKGRASIMGMDCWKKASALKKHIGYVPGEIAFPDVKSGTDFLNIQADFMRLKDRTYADSLTQRLALDTSAPVKRMSKGMKQKTAIVAAFMAQPDILLLDEPTIGLDPLMRDTVIELMVENKKQGKTIFVSSHMFNELEGTCDRIAFLKAGKILDIADMNTITGHDADKEYKIEFTNQQDYNRFRALRFCVVRTQDAYNQVTVRILDQDLKDLFAALSNLDVRFISYKPYTLEDYFNEKFKNTEDYDHDQ